jgi:hypothetical protein
MGRLRARLVRIGGGSQNDGISLKIGLDMVRAIYWYSLQCPHHVFTGYAAYINPILDITLCQRESGCPVCRFFRLHGGL